MYTTTNDEEFPTMNTDPADTAEGRVATLANLLWFQSGLLTGVTNVLRASVQKVEEAWQGVDSAVETIELADMDDLAEVMDRQVATLTATVLPAVAETADELRATTLKGIDVLFDSVGAPTDVPTLTPAQIDTLSDPVEQIGATARRLSQDASELYDQLSVLVDPPAATVSAADAFAAATFGLIKAFVLAARHVHLLHDNADRMAAASVA